MNHMFSVIVLEVKYFHTLKNAHTVFQCSAWSSSHFSCMLVLVYIAYVPLASTYIIIRTLFNVQNKSYQGGSLVNIVLIVRASSV